MLEQTVCQFYRVLSNMCETTNVFHMTNLTSDRSGVEMLIAKYAKAVDMGDVEAYLACWAPTGTSEAAYGVAKGHDALRVRFEQMQASGFSKGKRHVVTNITLQLLDASRAAASSYLIVIERESPPPRVIATGTYDDVVAFSEGVWRFEARKLTLDPSFTRP
jgi:3-phenylpropionate/cinnamic acid dioxygenase small subunit